MPFFIQPLGGAKDISQHFTLWLLQIKNQLCGSYRFTSLVYPFSVGDWPIVIFLKNRSLVSNTGLTHEHIISYSTYCRFNEAGDVSGVRTSLPGDRARVHVQAGKAGDLFFSQSRGISLFYA